MSKTYIEYSEDPATGDIVGRFTVAKADLVSAKFDNFDRLQLDSPPKSMADIALDLELVLRRIEQSQPNPVQEKQE